MDRIVVVTDSVSCLPQELVQKYNISIVPAGNIYYEGKTYRDWLDLSYQEAYRILENSPRDFFTGPTSPGEFVEVFRQLSQDYNVIIYISLSSKLSTLFNSARVARDLAKKELPQNRIEIFDSSTATAAQGFIALAAASAAQQGKSLEEILRKAREVKSKVDLFYVLDTVKYVYRSGRIPHPVARVGSRLNVKPLVTIKKGSAQLLGLVRNKNRGIESLLRIARDRISSHPVHIAILHADAPDEAAVLKQKIQSEFNCTEIWVSVFSPLMVYVTGKYVLGIAFYIEDTDAPPIPH